MSYSNILVRWGNIHISMMPVCVCVCCLREKMKFCCPCPHWFCFLRSNRPSGARTFSFVADQGSSARLRLIDDNVKSGQLCNSCFAASCSISRANLWYWWQAYTALLRRAIFCIEGLGEWGMKVPLKGDSQWNSWILYRMLFYLLDMDIKIKYVVVVPMNEQIF